MSTCGIRFKVLDMVNKSMSLSEINFEMAGYLLDIDLMFAYKTFL